MAALTLRLTSILNNNFKYLLQEQRSELQCTKLALHILTCSRMPKRFVAPLLKTAKQCSTDPGTPHRRSITSTPPPSPSTTCSTPPSSVQSKYSNPLSDTVKSKSIHPPTLKSIENNQNKTTTKDKDKNNITKQKLTSAVVRQNVKGYVFTRYFDHVKNYDKVLEKNFPSAVKFYRVFFDGVKEFFSDMKRYLKVTRIVNESPLGIRALNRKELELYMQLPRDMVKVAPAIIMSSLPMIGYAIFPLAVMYPRTFLTTHFWTLQQKSQFQELKLKERLSCNRSIFRFLQSKVFSIGDTQITMKIEKILGLIGSGFHPSIDMILDIREIFAKPPYSYNCLTGKHIKLLCQLHDVPRGWFKRHRLREHAFLIHYMDLAIRREGDVHNLQPDALRYACFIRGLNPANMSNEQLIDWLRIWIKISTEIKHEHISLFLHLPIFIGYNHPNNWQLIYSKTKIQFLLHGVNVDSFIETSRKFKISSQRFAVLSQEF